MRNSNGTASTINMTRSSGRASEVLLTQADIADGYDFNRARSTESTENAFAGKSASAAAVVSLSTTTASSSSKSVSPEGRGVPISPKKLPQTPPRDHGSPYRATSAAASTHSNSSSQTCGLDLMPPATVRQPFLPTSGSRISSSRLFLKPSKRHQQQQHQEEQEDNLFGSSTSIFRSSSRDLGSRGDETYYSIHRSMAFDEDDE